MSSVFSASLAIAPILILMVWSKQAVAQKQEKDFGTFTPKNVSIKKTGVGTNSISEKSEAQLVKILKEQFAILCKRQKITLTADELAGITKEAEACAKFVHTGDGADAITCCRRFQRPERIKNKDGKIVEERQVLFQKCVILLPQKVGKLAKHEQGHVTSRFQLSKRKGLGGKVYAVAFAKFNGQEIDPLDRRKIQLLEDCLFKAGVCFVTMSTAVDEAYERITDFGRVGANQVGIANDLANVAERLWDDCAKGLKPTDDFDICCQQVKNELEKLKTEKDLKDLKKKLQMK